MLKKRAKQLLKQTLPPTLLSILRLGRDYLFPEEPVSAEYEVLTGFNWQPMASVPTGYWSYRAGPRKQQAAFAPLLELLRQGHPREDFLALARAVEETSMQNPFIVELGCGSGWNWLVLDQLFKKPFIYIGLDCSPAMIAIARRQIPGAAFVVGDALAAPFPDAACDILVSGTVLMHLLDYLQGIRESRRLARQWCIFHTIPIFQRRETTFFRKLAYGFPTVEVVFNEDELFQHFADCGLEVRATFQSIDYDLEFIVGEHTTTRTYLCAVGR